jgi:glycosyltransferase involved in cell wall biosynthesis
MRVVIVHYHLKPGGVTTVIRRHLDACSRKGVRAFLLVGEEPAESPDVPYAVLPELAYDAPGPRTDGDAARERGKGLARSLAAAAHELAGGEPDVFHVHNPTLRKNAALCPALSELAADGKRILIQAHDFAEDWRPDVLLRGLPYPAGCRWAALNGRDLAALRSAGVPEPASEILPNPLPKAPVAGPGRDGGSRGKTVLYPVRGIRRKNLGELLLLARWLPPGFSAAVTLPPNNPRDFPVYASWKTLARELGSPVVFEAGLSSPLDSLYARCRSVVTTSVKEGFGFSFLEPLVRGVGVAGRRLSSVVPDFEAEGLRYPALYPAIRIPLDFFDAPAFAERLAAALDSVAAAVSDALGGRPPWLDERLREVRAAALPESEADFAVLDETAQTQVLRRLGRKGDDAESLAQVNPFLESWWEAPAPAPSDEAALAVYSPERSADRLLGVYERTVAGGAGPAPDRDRLARALLKPEGFFCPGL